MSRNGDYGGKRKDALENINPHALTGGCRVCGGKTDGKYCEEHSRQMMPRDMSVVYHSRDIKKDHQIRKYG